MSSNQNVNVRPAVEIEGWFTKSPTTIPQFLLQGENWRSDWTTDITCSPVWHAHRDIAQGRLVVTKRAGNIDGSMWFSKGRALFMKYSVQSIVIEWLLALINYTAYLCVADSSEQVWLLNKLVFSRCQWFRVECARRGGGVFAWATPRARSGRSRRRTTTHDHADLFLG